MMVLIDTCVILDAICSREPFDNDAKKIFEGSALKHFDGIISAKSVSDIYYLVHKFTHNNIETRKVIHNLLLVFYLVDTCGVDIRRALDLNIKDYEDAILVESAKRVGADCIVTRNIKDFQNSGINVLTPSDFLKTIDSKSLT